MKSTGTQGFIQGILLKEQVLRFLELVFSC